MSTPQHDPLTALITAGFPLEGISEDQRAVFATLSPEEVTLLIDLRTRLDAMAPKVQAYDVAGTTCSGGQETKR